MTKAFASTFYGYFRIEAEIDRYHNLEPVNNSSLMSNGDFYLNFRERYWLHLLLARVQLNRALMQSSKLMYFPDHTKAF